MLRSIRRQAPVVAGVRFCDPCAEVSTAEQRARLRFEQARTRAYLLAGPR